MKELDKAIHGRRTLIFIDLEGTQTTHEIIEIGAYKVLLRDDLSIKKIHKPYHAYVLPKNKVGPFVTRLTGITDLKLKKEGIPFRLAITQLKKYLGKDFKKEPLFVSYGPSDAAMFLSTIEHNMDASVDDVRFIARHFFDVESFIGQYVRDDNGNIMGLTKILNLYGVEFEGTAHSALDDANNLILLFKAFLEKKDITAHRYEKVLAKGAHMPPIASKIISRLSHGETVTPDDYHLLIAETLK